MKYIKLFEHNYTIYQLATMPMWKASELLLEEIKKDVPDIQFINDLFEYSKIYVNWQDERGMTALIWASIKGHSEIVQMLLARPEIRVNLQSKNGSTALILASYNHNTEVVRLLLERPEIDVNVENQYGKTALIFASGTGHKEIANLIRSHPNFKETL